MLTKNEVARASVNLIIRLSLLDDVLGNAESSAESLAKKTNPSVNAAQKAWKAAAEDALQHVLLVVKNNPGKTMDEILARPDVKMALDKPFAQAGGETQSLIQKAWTKGWSVGSAAAGKDLTSLGVGPPSGTPKAPSGVLPKLLQDAADNASGAQQRLTDTMLESSHGAVETDLRKVLDDLARRAKLGVDVARSRATTESQIAAYQQAAAKTGQQINLVWATRFRPTTCATCAALHGTTVPLGGSFDPDLTFSGKPPGLYVDLAGPPRHPNCGCHIVAYLGTPPTSSMSQWAKSWWAKKTGK